MKRMRLVLVLAVMVCLAGWQPQSVHADTAIVPDDDTFVRNKVGERDTNFDEDEDELNVTAEGFPLGVPIDIAYLRFDVTSASGATVDTATLRLYGQYNAPNVVIAVFSTDGDDWNGEAEGMGDETTLTFNNAPGQVDQLDGAITSSGAPGWWEFGGPELAAYVQAQLPDNGGDGYITLRVMATSTGIADIQSFEDHEQGGGTGNYPQLVIEGEPTAVELSSFTATPGVDEILLEWETVSELYVAGFNLRRAEDGGEQILLNDELIESQMPGDLTGASYQYNDETAMPGITYHYWLECLDVHGGSTFFQTVGTALTGFEYYIYLPLVIRD